MAQGNENLNVPESEDPIGVSHRLGDGLVSTNSVPFTGQIKLGGFHRTLLRAIGKLPLPARSGVRNNILLVHDARTLGERIGAAASVNLFYGIATAGHALGLVGQVNKVATELSLVRPGNAWELANVAIDGATAGLLASIIYAHTVLTVGLDRRLVKNRHMPESTPIKAHTYTPLSRALKDVGITAVSVVGIGVAEAGVNYLASR